MCPNRNRVQINCHEPTLPTHDAHAPEPLHPSFDGVRHGAVLVGNPLFLRIAHIHQAGDKSAAIGGAATHAREPFHPSVPQHDGGLAVDEHHAVVHVVNELL